MVKKSSWLCGNLVVAFVVVARHEREERGEKIKSHDTTREIRFWAGKFSGLSDRFFFLGEKRSAFFLFSS